jgi:hypothetical protein
MLKGCLCEETPKYKIMHQYSKRKENRLVSDGILVRLQFDAHFAKAKNLSALKITYLADVWRR